MELTEFIVISISSTTVLIILTFFIFMIWNRNKKNSLVDGRKLPRVEGGLPLLDRTLDFLPSNRLSSMSLYYQKYGPIFELYKFPFKRVIVVADAKLSTEILSHRPKIFQRDVDFHKFFRCFTYLPISLMNLEGEQWSQMRRLISPSFNHLNILKLFNPVAKEVRNFISNLSSLANDGREFNFRKEAVKFSSRSICQIALGFEDQSVRVKEYCSSESLINDFDSLKHFFYLAWLPIPVSIIKWILPESTNAENRLNSIFKEVLQTEKDIYQLKCQQTSRIQPHSLIEVLLMNNDDLTDDQILSQVEIFFLAGADSTAITLTWSLFNLCIHPSLLQEVRKEAIEFYKLLSLISNEKELGTNDLDLEDLNKVYELMKTHLTLGRAFIKETIRLFPPSSFAAVQLCSSKVPYTLSNGVIINPNDKVTIYIDGICKDPDVFINSEVFDPYRWINSPKDLLTKMESSFLAFGTGSRKCPGTELVLNLEVVLAMTSIIKEFDIKLACPQEEIKREFNFVSDVNKMPLIFKLL